MSGMLEVVVAAVLLVACIAAWAWLLIRRKPGVPLVPYESRRAVPWDLPVLGLVMVLIWLRLVAGSYVDGRLSAEPKIAAQVEEVVQRELAKTPTPSPQMVELARSRAKWGVADYAGPMFQLAAVTQFITVVLVAFVLRLAYRADRNDFGISTRRIGFDVRVGVLGFFSLAVPAVLLQGTLHALGNESEHPIILAFKNSAGGSAFLWATVAAVVVAPVAEEFLFRTVLQGMFERHWAQPAESSSSDLESTAAAATNPSAIPIFISAAIFALMHLGIDVVPLFFLALGLGYLYRQTHRLWPGIVVHSLLNAFSMAMLLLQTK